LEKKERKKAKRKNPFQNLKRKIQIITK